MFLCSKHLWYFAFIAIANFSNVVPLTGRACQGSPGELTQIAAGDLDTGSFVVTSTSYECVVNEELRCFVTIGGQDSTVYRVEESGALSLVQNNFAANDVVASLASFKCEGSCFVAASVQDAYLGAFLRIYSVSSVDGTLAQVAQLPQQDLSRVDAFVCNGACYIITSGEESENKLYSFDGTVLTEILSYDTQNAISALATFECEGKWWLVTGTSSQNQSIFGSTLYTFDPCTTSFEIIQSPFIALPYSDQFFLLSLRPYVWQCKCYVAVYGINSETFTYVLQNYVLDPYSGELEKVGEDIELSQQSFAAFYSLEAYSCGCACYVTIGSFAPHNNVYQVENSGQLTLVQERYVSAQVNTLTSYECCGTCYVLSGGSNPASNALFVVHSPIVETHNNCFCILGGGAFENLDLFGNDCGCIDVSSVLFYADEALTVPIGTSGSFANAPTPGGGKLNYIINGSVSYMPPENGPVTDVFYYTINDCCDCQDCAKVTIFVKEVSTSCDWNVITVPCL